jgi:hypothetical protein
MRNLIRIFYVSRIAPGLDKPAIVEILRASSVNNQNSGITGVLCYKGGHFAQIIEGEETAVLELYLKISRDRRHQDPVIVSIATTDRQRFKGWAMGGIEADLIPSVDIDEVLKLRSDVAESSDAVAIMNQWLKLL